ncbi:Uncharacterised protein [Bordetella pertussis]|nr:Uncharacterised protein [Bordetella pertussis]
MSRQARNFSSAVASRTIFLSRGSSAPARCIVEATNMHADNACSVGTMIFNRLRFISGCAITGLPKAARRRAKCRDSFRHRRIMPAARTPCESREALMGRTAYRMPSLPWPMAWARAPSKTTSPVAIERVPSLFLSRAMR